MSDDREDSVPDWRTPIDPVAMARRDLKKALPRRFYSEVSIETAKGGGFELRLDGRPLRTPAKAVLVVPTRGLADALAEEWRDQVEVVDPAMMPLTRLVNSALDGVARHDEATIAEVAKFAETDLVCYRAGEPAALVREQAQAWDPILAFAREELGARFICAEGIVFAKQPDSARAAVRDAIATLASGASGALRLAALSVMTSLTGSVLLALAVARGHLDAQAAWRAGHIDEDYQMRQWGADEDALVRREQRWREMRAAATLYHLSAG